MSLLLDALKKAEKAKEDASRRSHLAEGADPDPTVLQVRTRNELPDISAPLEIHTEDVSSSPVPDAFSTAPPARPVQHSPIDRPLEAPATPMSKAKKPAQPATGSTDPQAAQRTAAKQVFEAKFREPNPRLPFLITMALLGAFALGTVIYFWYQLRPPPPLVNPNAKPPADEKKMEPSASPPPAPQLAALPSGPGQVAAPEVAGLPSSQPKATTPRGEIAVQVPSQNPPTDPAVKPKPSGDSASTIARAPTADRSPRPGSPPRTQGPTAPSRLSINRPAPAVNPKLEAGWAAYNRGELDNARASYQAMLREEPANRDALLGMAALEVRANRLDEAETYYRTLLLANPRDPYAQAGLMALKAQVGDPVQGESRVKSMIASDPDAQVLYFSLGNQYAQQGRWSEAQTAYFKAYSAEPENPDFAYNLAVSLDHMRQAKLALEYYRRAMTLSQTRTCSFDQALARSRIQELSR